MLLRAPCSGGKPRLGGFCNRTPLRIRAWDRSKRRPTKCRRADVAQTARRVAPAAVGILMVGQPSEPALDERAVRGFLRAGASVGNGQCRHRRRGGECAGGKFSDPMAAFVSLGEEFRPGRLESGLDPTRIDPSPGSGLANSGFGVRPRPHSCVCAAA